MQNLLCRPLWDDEGRQIQTFQWVITIPIILSPPPSSIYVLAVVFTLRDDEAEFCNDNTDDDNEEAGWMMNIARIKIRVTSLLSV